MEKTILVAFLSLIFAIYHVVKAIGLAQQHDDDAAFFTMAAGVIFAYIFVILIKKIFFSNKENNNKEYEIKNEEKREKAVLDNEEGKIEDRNNLSTSENSEKTLNDIFANQEIIKEAKSLRRLYGKNVYFDFIKRKAKEMNVNINEDELKLGLSKK
jgi:hypothetical protein